MILQRITSTVLSTILAVSAVLWVYGRYQQKPVPVPAREAANPPAIRPREPGTYIKVLAIDGAGIRMIPALHCLAYLEKRGGKPIAEMFDIVVGTSTGALIAAALTAPSDAGRPRFTAQELLDQFPSLMEKMYAAPLIHPLLSLEGRTAPKFLTRKRQRVVLDIFGETTQLGEALTTLILPAYAIESRIPFVFASDMGKSTSVGAAGMSSTEAGDYFLADAVIAATGDADVFAPSRVTNVTGEQTFTFVSARTFAENPTILAVSESLLRFPDRQCVVISLGSGAIPAEASVPGNGWDAIASPEDLVAMAAQGSTIIGNQVATVIHRFGSGPLAAYIRLNPTLPPEGMRFADFSKATVEELNQAGSRLTAEKYATLDQTADFMVTH